MGLKRKPFQGVFNILRFNWHFFLIAGLIPFVVLLLKSQLPEAIQALALWGAILAILTMAISLLVSFYIYDLSALYQLNWLGNLDQQNVLTINAGFDETSDIILSQYPNATLSICDFYDPIKHTEVSIKRARRAYPPNPKTITVQTDQLPFPDNTFDRALAILSAHEIRDEQERVQFFNELKRVTKSSGQIMVTEHLRDWNNFLAYTIGFLHFHSKASWLRTFQQAKLSVKREIKTTPFISTFILEKHGNSL